MSFQLPKFQTWRARASAPVTSRSLEPLSQRALCTATTARNWHASRQANATPPRMVSISLLLWRAPVMLRVQRLATPAALWKAGQASNPGTPPGASGSQSNSTKPKHNLRPAPGDGMALVPLTDALVSFGTAARLPTVVIGPAGNADGLGTRSWAAVSELSASSATVVRAAHATGEEGKYEEFAAARSLQSGSVKDRTSLATRWAGSTPLQRPDRRSWRPDRTLATRRGSSRLRLGGRQCDFRLSACESPSLLCVCREMPGTHGPGWVRG